MFRNVFGSQNSKSETAARHVIESYVSKAVHIFFGFTFKR